MKYIAYGSNMVQEHMALRCPDARLIGTGYLQGARLEFYYHATVEKTKDRHSKVPVAVWELNENDEKYLDLYEAFPEYYTKEIWPVYMNDGTRIEGMIYLMKTISHYPPDSFYYRDIEDAYRKLGLSSQIEKVLRPALVRSVCRGIQW